MRALLRFTLISCLLVWCASAQRGGGHGGGMGGGFHGGGMGGGFHGGGMGGGFRGGMGGGFRGGMGGGFRGGGFGFNRGGFGFNRGGFGFNRGGFGFKGNRFIFVNRGFGFNRFGFGGVWPWWGWGWGWPGYSVAYWPGSWGSPYYDTSDYPYDYGSYPQQTYPTYNAAPTVAVYSAPSAPEYSYAPPSSETARPVMHSYDQYGQELQPSGRSGSPIYLFAMRDGVIRAAASYWVQGGTLHYVTLQHEEKTVPLTSLDRTLTNQLNRERHVNLSLGQ